MCFHHSSIENIPTFLNRAGRDFEILRVVSIGKSAHGFERFVGLLCFYPLERLCRD